MWKNKIFVSLNKKLLLRFFTGFFIAITSFFLLYNLFQEVLYSYFMTSSYIVDKEQKYLSDLQNYVTTNNIAATDTAKLRIWTKTNNITLFSVSREHVLIFDNLYTGNAPLSETDAYQLNITWQFFQPIEFSDGVADVYIYKNYQRNYYVLAIIISGFISSVIWAFTLFLFMKGHIKYIDLLSKEAQSIRSLKTNNHFTIKGNDELTILALTLDQMKIALEKSLINEEIQRKEKEKLALGMAHDLRTPLTGLIGFLELSKKAVDKESTDIYLEKAIKKTYQLQELSDKLFESFLVKKSSDHKTDDSDSPYYYLNDYLSDLCSQISMYGFNTSIDALKWDNIPINANLEYTGRIIDNITSNIIKYADTSYPIKISSNLTTTHYEICISNNVKNTSREFQGTRIGVSNIQIMMEMMQGLSTVHATKNEYSITLSFSIVNKPNQTL